MFGVLLDVSGSMRKAYSLDKLHDGGDVSVERMHAVFTTVAKIVEREVTHHERHESIFACGFGLRKPQPVGNFIQFFTHISAVLNGGGRDALVELANQHCRDYLAPLIRQHMTDIEASTLLWALRNDESLLKTLEGELPGRTLTRLFHKISSHSSEEFVMNMTLSYKHVQDIISKKFCKNLAEPIEPISVQYVSRLMTELTSSAKPSVYDYIQELVDFMEPYIYGDTPMCDAMKEALRIFKQVGADTTKVLFILSDGKSTDGDPRPMAQELRALGVRIVTCYLTSDDVPNPKCLFDRYPIASWKLKLRRKCQHVLFEMSSTMKNAHTPISYLADAGWELPPSGESCLFVEANSLNVVNELCEIVVSQLTKGCDALVDVLEKVPLATYINQTNADFLPRDQHRESTCYAHAIAATFHLAMHRIVGREGGVPDFDTIRDCIIHEYGKNGANTVCVLEAVCPEYRLHFRKVDETGARKAINRRRPVVARFRLYPKQWEKFAAFFKNTRKGILKRTELKTSEPMTTKAGGHAVVLTRCDPDCLTLMNSWGTDWADGGFFRVTDQSVLNEMEFYDVYWTEDDLTDSEKRAYTIESTRRMRELMEEFPSLKDFVYQCPNCKCGSKAYEFSGNLLEAVCSKCHQMFKPTNESILQGLYSRNMTY